MNPFLGVADNTFRSPRNGGTTVAAQLFISCHETSESILLLIHQGRLWDADILMRSILEGSVKYCFMLSGTEEEIEANCREFWDIHPELLLRRDGARAKETLSRIGTSGNGDNPIWEPLRDMVVLGESPNDSWDKYGRKGKQALDYKWSVSGILKHFASCDDGLFASLTGPHYGYGMSCHQSHLDGIALGQRRDRITGPRNRERALTIGHAARLVSDIITYYQIRILVFKRAYNEAPIDIFNGNRDFQKLVGELEEAQNEFANVEFGDKRQASTRDK
ncbi:DUF5677 domain-containing protein [Desulfovibrio caledoniensis]